MATNIKINLDGVLAITIVKALAFVDAKITDEEARELINSIQKDEEFIKALSNMVEAGQ